jgi:chromosome segregation ATPase
VIEQIMYFALGVLGATLVALMVLPAVWHRAVRLTTRRIEAAVPISMFEIQAEKDQQRAGFALNQRRLELQLDAVRENVVAHAGTIEQQRLQLVELDKALSAKTAAHEALTLAHGELDARFTAEQTALIERNAQLAQTSTTLEQTAADLSQTRGTLAATTARADDLATRLAARETELAARVADIAALQAERTQLSTDLAAVRAALAETSATLATERAAASAAAASAEAERLRLEAALADTSQRLAASEALAAERAVTLSAQAADIESLTTRLAASTADLEASRGVLQALSQQRANEFAAAQAQQTRLSQALDMLRADHSMMEAALAKARAERDAHLEREEDLDLLRKTLAGLAEQVVTLAAPSASNGLAGGPTIAPALPAEAPVAEPLEKASTGRRKRAG